MCIIKNFFQYRELVGYTDVIVTNPITKKSLYQGITQVNMTTKSEAPELSYNRLQFMKIYSRTRALRMELIFLDIPRNTEFINTFSRGT